MRIIAVIAALMLGGCVPIIKPAHTTTPPHAPMTPQQEAAAWCALGLYGPGMAGFCDEKRGE